MRYSISLIICTRNRAAHLSPTLSGILSCFIPPDTEVELLIIDNGSTDDTPLVIKEISSPSIKVRHIVEPTVGQCHARNRGLQEMCGNIALYTDDDVRVPEDWIEKMCRPILNGEADAVAGGVIFAPHFNGCDKTFAAWLASTHDIDQASPERMVGANMAFGRHVLEKVPAFDVELGPGALGFADETLFSWQLREAGYKIAGRLDVAVEHHFEPSRLSRSSILSSAIKIGRCDAYLAWHWFHSDMPMTKLGDWWRLLNLWAGRLFLPWTWLRSNKTSPWEAHLLRELAFRHQYRIEHERPRQYSKLGLVKRVEPLILSSEATHHLSVN